MPCIINGLSSLSPLQLFFYFLRVSLHSLIHSRAAADASTSQEKTKDTSKIRKRYIRLYVFSIALKQISEPLYGIVRKHDGMAKCGHSSISNSVIDNLDLSFASCEFYF